MPTVVTQTPDIELGAAVWRALRRVAPAASSCLNAKTVIGEIGAELSGRISSTLECGPLSIPEGDPDS